MKTITFETLLKNCDYDIKRHCDHFDFFMARLRLVEFLQYLQTKKTRWNNEN
jgi:hypothetical protein